MLLHYVQQPVTNAACRTQSEQAAAAPSQRVQEFVFSSNGDGDGMGDAQVVRGVVSGSTGAGEGTAVVKKELSCKAKLSI